MTPYREGSRDFPVKPGRRLLRYALTGCHHDPDRDGTDGGGDRLEWPFPFPQPLPQTRLGSNPRPAPSLPCPIAAGVARYSANFSLPRRLGNLGAIALGARRGSQFPFEGVG
ncbi:hypothetical protein JJD41_05170 [Oxynema sp. CENA135]|uniref:hypothetical protein n=1 Tax=Oxynema sp. CENA135 TaxID=984206 RepID=UPI00190CA658|nr:hypothetical protein [Oxynema sp. CENA135]MBK4729277.1 hypothetical protein [Oxynema sp. CENA135]